ncbi:MAG: hypothetical protein K5912_04535 [Alphaproteobacteria bacterium]|nr:hypothetical protein [Alphaproteobacteria bacterium]
MSEDLSKIIAMVSGQSRNAFDTETISQAVREQIAGAFDNIFLGESLLIWSHGGTLAEAWKTSLDDLREKVFAIPANSNIVKYLRVAVFEHRKQWEIKITNSNERNSIAVLNNKELEELNSQANFMIKSGTQTIQNLIQNPTQHTLENEKTHLYTHEKNMERTHERTRTRN